MNIGKGIRKALIDAELTQVWLAKELGVSRQTINGLCNSESANLKTLIKVSTAIGLHVTDLILLGEEK